MSKKFKLFASVAGPVLTLPLLMQPAAALPLAPAVQNGARANIVEVQAQVIVPPNGQGAEEGEGQQRPRRHQQDQGQGGAEQGGQQRPPRQQGTDAEGGQPQRPQRQQGGDTEGGQQRPPRQMQGQGQAQPGEEGGAQRPARQQQSDEGSGQQQRPPRQQQADQPAVRPQAEAPAQKPADNPAPHAPAPQAEQPKPKPQPSQSAEPQQQPAARPAQAPQEPAKQAPQPAPQHAAPAEAAPKPPVAQKAEPATPAPKPPAQADAPQQRPAEPQAQPGQPKPEAAPQTEPRTTPKTQAQQPAGEAPAGRPQGQPAQQPAQARPTTPPAGEAPANAPAAAPGSNQAGTPPQRPGAQPASPPGGAAPQGHSPNPVPGQAPGQGSGQALGQPQGVPQGQPPGQPQGTIPGRAPSQTPGQAQGQPPVQQNGVAPNATQPNAAQQAGAVQQPPPPAVTPQQVERAKELAKDPSAAKPGEQLVLPVENGAAVLDSAKQPMQMRPQRGGPQGGPQGGQQAGPQGGAQGGPAGNGPNGRPFPPQDAGMPVAPPRSDADAQVGTRETRQQQQQFQALDQERGQRLGERPQFDRPRGWDFDPSYAPPQGRDRDDHRVIITIDNQPVVRHDDSRRFYEDGGSQPEYDQLRDGRVREVITRDDGTRIVTIRNRYGEVIQRSRVVRGGQEYVLYYAPDLMNQDRSQNYQWRDPGDDLPPMRLSVPVDDYIIDTSSQPNRDYYRFLEQPPVERVERVYSLDEVRYSARIRDKVRRIDLDTITFATGSADVPMNQAGSLRRVADAIKEVLGRDPSETFLIEGHTDAVGSAQSNLILSDQRAESVAQVLTSAFGIPPENLATQGYGEQFLKVRTDGPSQENRRVTIRRITALVKPVASNR